MKQHPIIFSTPMVQAILEGRKTQTRRIIKSRNKSGLFQVGKYNGIVVNVWAVDEEEGWEHDISCPYGENGDILWVRESFRGIEQDFGEDRYEYKATEKINLIDKWKPSIHMPRSAARIFLKVTGIRVERLKEISEEDAIAEGVEMIYPNDNLWKNYLTPTPLKESARESYLSLWHSIHKTDPVYIPQDWVWVIEFEKINQP